MQQLKENLKKFLALVFVICLVSTVVFVPAVILGTVYNNSRVYFIGTVEEVTSDSTYIISLPAGTDGDETYFTHVATKEVPYGFQLDGIREIKKGTKFIVIKSDKLQYATVYHHRFFLLDGYEDNTQIFFVTILILVLILWNYVKNIISNSKLLFLKMTRDFEQPSISGGKLLSAIKISTYVLRLFPSIVAIILMSLLALGVSKIIFWSEGGQYNILVGLILYAATIFFVFIAPKAIVTFYDLKFNKELELIVLIRNILGIFICSLITYKLISFLFFKNKVYESYSDAITDLLSFFSP